MKKYVIKMADGTCFETKYLNNLILFIEEKKDYEKLTDNEICLLHSGMDIDKKDKDGGISYIVEVVAV